MKLVIREAVSLSTQGHPWVAGEALGAAISDVPVAQAVEGSMLWVEHDDLAEAGQKAVMAGRELPSVTFFLETVTCALASLKLV